jgi:hypothetical protein
MGSPPSDAPTRRRLPGRDTSAGIFFLAAGLAGLWGGSDLSVGTADAMAEGYFPRAICILLAVIGAAILVGALRRRDPRIGRLGLRPLSALTGSIVAFAIGLERLGLVLTILISVAIANLAARPMRILPLFALVTVLVVSIAAVFVWGLGLPLRMFPRWLGWRI